MPDSPRPRWLIIVKRDRLKLYQNLRESVRDDPRVEVIFDRRESELFTEAIPPEVAKRRKPMTPRQAETWNDLGFFAIHRGEAMTLYEALGPPMAP